MTEHEIACRAAINVLRDSVESRRMPSGLDLTPDAADVHERAARYLERLARKASMGTEPHTPCEGDPSTCYVDCSQRHVCRWHQEQIAYWMQPRPKVTGSVAP
jgi:hypothetical protein